MTKSKSNKKNNFKEAWVISADMGYGHMRAVHPLRKIAYNDRIIIANNDDIIVEKEKKIWKKAKILYEFISRMNDIPLIGKYFFNVYDNLQNISPFFPFRDQSKPTYLVKYAKKLILKKGLGKSLIDEISRTDLPLFTSFYIPALAADYHNIKNKIYCLITDTDLNRIWVTDNPSKSNIMYLAPCRHVVQRLRQYGVKDKNIILTGFPLPHEIIGGKDLSILRNDFAKRIQRLDPKGVFVPLYKEHIMKLMNLKKWPKIKSNEPLTITYLVGGAGAQKEVGYQICKSLKKEIVAGKIKINLVAGIRSEIKGYFEDKIQNLKMNNHINQNINIIYSQNIMHYFKILNQELRNTDIIWTKPSEMSFYTALGFPVITSDPIGSHEKWNLQWLEHIGSAFKQEDPNFIKDWLFYWLDSGRFAQSALDGFTEAPTLGTYVIEDLILKNRYGLPKEKYF
jgi:hypothetical protein